MIYFYKFLIISCYFNIILSNFTIYLCFQTETAINILKSS